MDSVKINLTGDREAGLRFEEFPDALYEGLRKEIDALTNELFARVVARTPELTGALRAEERVRIFADENRIRGYIDVHGSVADIKKAAALEYGAHKTVNVSAYERPNGAVVKAYSRPNDVVEKAFERGPLEEMRGEINARLNAVVEKAVAGANA
jgi:hypothetical protein